MATIAVLIANDYEDVEYTEPAAAFQDAGHSLIHVGVEAGVVRGKRSKSEVIIEKGITEVAVDDFDVLFIPGGHSPDNLRSDERIVEFVREFVERDKPIFAICHGAQLLISADVVEGRTLTAWPTVQKDLEYAGANVEDKEVVIDDNLITSRKPDDIPAFVEACLELLEDVEEEKT